MPLCEECKKEVVVSPDEEYVYVLVSFGKPGKERPAFFHKDCFGQILRVKSALFEEFKEKVDFNKQLPK